MHEHVAIATQAQTTNCIDDDVPLSAGWRTVYRACEVMVR